MVFPSGEWLVRDPASELGIQDLCLLFIAFLIPQDFII